MNDAPISRRFIAFLLDFFIAGALMSGLLYVLDYYTIFSVVSRFAGGEEKAYLQVYILFIGIFFIYELLSTLLLRATPGKIMANIETEFPGNYFVGRTFLRSLLKTITVATAPIGIPLTLLFGFARNSSGVIHDAICKSSITNESRCPRLFGILIFALAAACFYVFYVHYQQYFLDLRLIKIPTLY